MKTPINSERIGQHVAYSWWKYLLMAVLGGLAVNLLYSVTTYRSPADKVVDLYVYGVAADQLTAYVDRVHEEQMADMEEMNVLMLSTDETYGAMQIMTYVAAGEGDVYILPRDEFVSMASSGAWIPLEEDEELVGMLTDAGASLQSGWRRQSDSGESHLYGIPVSRLPGLADYVYVENGYLCVLITGGNDENALKFLRILCRDML